MFSKTSSPLTRMHQSALDASVSFLVKSEAVSPPGREGAVSEARGGGLMGRLYEKTLIKYKQIEHEL